MAEETLEYSKEYSRFKVTFRENAEKLFDSWVRDSGVNVELNRETSNKYRKAVSDHDALSKLLRKERTKKGFATFFAVVGFITSILSLIILIQNAQTSPTFYYVCIPLIIVGLALGISLIIVIKKKLNPKINELQGSADEMKRKADSLLDECYNQLRPLYARFRDSATAELVRQTVPIIQLDNNFNMRRFDFLKNKFGLTENLKENESTIGIISGEILGNPFIEERRLRQSWGRQTYTGSIVIHWTETEYDSEGKMKVVHKSQTLTASVTKPKPLYDTYSRLIYGNEAAPDLTFSRKPSHAERMTEKEIDKKVAKYEKELSKLENDALKKGREFTAVSNVEFEMLFGATNRNNEVQFRLLFTPLAEKNMLHLMKTPEPFGDDFYFEKNHTLNFIRSEHAQNWDFEVDSKRYMLYDIDMCREAFLKFNDEYFVNLYFELAPIMSIPLYQQYKTREYIYRDSYYRNYTSYEAEVLGNAISSGLAPETGDTQPIIKSALVKKQGKVDNILYIANAFEACERISYIPTFGGDGFYHDVPVRWIEYVPVSKSTYANMVELEGDYNNSRDSSSAIKHNLKIDLLGSDV